MEIFNTVLNAIGRYILQHNLNQHMSPPRSPGGVSEPGASTTLWSVTNRLNCNRNFKITLTYIFSQLFESTEEIGELDNSIWVTHEVGEEHGQGMAL